MPGHNDGTICKVSEMNKELPESLRRKFFPLPPHPLQKKKKSFKVPKDTKGKLYNPDLKNRSKPQTFHGTVCVSVSNKKKQLVLQREKRDVFLWKRGLGSSYYLNCGSYKRLSHPLKENLQLFCPVTKEQTFWWGCWSLPREVGRGQEQPAASQPPWANRWATSLPI